MCSAGTVMSIVGRHNRPILLIMNLAQLSMVSKENLPKRNLTRSGNLFWMHCKYTNMKIKQNVLIYIYKVAVAHRL